MSYFKQLRASLENEELFPEEKLTPEAEAEADVAMAEAEVVRQEIENSIDSQERAESVVEELEGTNEALRNIASSSPDGTIDEATAAMVEAQRRTAAVAVGLDPDEGAGVELVDQAGLESLVDGTYVSLEETTQKNEGMIKKIRGYIANIYKWIKEKMNQFSAYMGKVFNTLPHQLKSAKDKIEQIKKANKFAEFNKYIDEQDKEKLSCGTATYGDIAALITGYDKALKDIEGNKAYETGTTELVVTNTLFKDLDNKSIKLGTKIFNIKVDDSGVSVDTVENKQHDLFKADSVYNHVSEATSQADKIKQLFSLKAKFAEKYSLAKANNNVAAAEKDKEASSNALKVAKLRQGYFIIISKVLPELRKETMRALKLVNGFKIEETAAGDVKLLN